MGGYDCKYVRVERVSSRCRSLGFCDLGGRQGRDLMRMSAAKRSTFQKQREKIKQDEEKGQYMRMDEEIAKPTSTHTLRMETREVY